MFNSTFRRTCLFAAGAVMVTTVTLGAAVAPAFAKENDVTVTAKKADLPTRIVRYADLDIATAKGEKLLLRRVSGAVNDVCHVDFGIQTGDFMVDHDCRLFAWRGARPQIAQALERARSNTGLAMSANTITIAAR